MKSMFTRLNANPTAGMEASNMVETDRFTTADTSESGHLFFSSDDGSILSGVWECAPCKSEFEAYPANEMMTIISGSVTLTSLDDGRSETYNAGESLFVAKGTRCIWENVETVRKFYFIAT